MSVAEYRGARRFCAVLTRKRGQFGARAESVKVGALSVSDRLYVTRRPVEFGRKPAI